MIHQLTAKYVFDEFLFWCVIFNGESFVFPIQTILFTTDEFILEQISTKDEMYVDQETADDRDENLRSANNRPPTGSMDVRPLTRAMLRRPFTAMRGSRNDQMPEYYGRSKSFERFHDQEISFQFI